MNVKNWYFLKVNPIALAYGLDVIKWEEREINNLKNEVYIYEGKGGLWEQIYGWYKGFI